jgi:hypothetical protein
VYEVPLHDALLGAFKTFLVRIGLSPEATTHITAARLSSMESLKRQDKNKVEKMCKWIERGTTNTRGVPLNLDCVKWLNMGTYAFIHRQYCG